MLAVFAAVLALAGAPASTPIACVHHMAHGDLGETTWNADGPTGILLLQNDACLAAKFAAANRQGRNRIAAANRNVSISQLYGTGLLVLLHEAEHVALKSRNECLVEKTAYAKLPTLLRMFAPRLAPIALQDAAPFNSERLYFNHC